MEQKNRLDFLDGVRGLAILMVVCLHYFVQIYDVPRSAFYNKQTPLFNLHFGVELFFVISGYVIFMTLDKTPGFISFMVRRWIRLFPAMLFATLFIYFLAHFIPYRPGGIPRLIDLVPGLSLLGANVISTLTGVKTDGLERGFWSIYVEVRFYVIFGVSYYLLGKRRSFFAMVGLSIMLLALLQIGAALGGSYVARSESLFGKILIGHHLPWFLLGMHIYLYHFRSHWPIFFLIVINAVLLNIHSIGAMGMALFIPALMYAVFTIERVQDFFRNRILLFLGFVSYPLYLLNDSLGRGIIRGLYREYSTQVPFELLGVLTFAVILIPCWCTAKFLEPPAQKWLKQLLFSEHRIKLAPAP